MNILILDTETTGLYPHEGHKVIEIAAILYSVDYKTILQQISTLLPVSENHAEKVNKISWQSSKEPMPHEQAINLIKLMAEHAQYVVAHNAEFDRKWMQLIGLESIFNMKWLCSYLDIEWPEEIKKKDLVNIAINYDVPITSAHRALTDCSLLSSIFTKESNLSKMIESAAEPRSLYIASIPIEEKDKAKNLGFLWNQLVPGKWAKKLKDSEAEDMPFRVIKVPQSI